MSGDTEQLPLGFTRAWIELKIVDEEWIEKAYEEFKKGDNPHPEHYRWKAFSGYWNSLETLTEDLARLIYKLGLEDQDFSMGGAIMASVLWHKACPAAILEEALVSEHAHLQKIAKTKL